MSEKMNMRVWKENVIANPRKRGVPVLSFPSVKLTGATVRELVTDAQTQADGMKVIAERTPSLAALSMMDLTVEAEACGSQIRLPENDVPATMGELIKTKEDAENLKVPEIGDGRTSIFIDAVRKAAEMITDRPVFAGIAGPYTMAGRLIGMTEMMMACMKDPEMVTITLEKCTEFIIKYALEYKKNTGANGFVMAEPMMGLLSPKLSRKFVLPYCRQIVEAVQDEEFIVVFHNCGSNVTKIGRPVDRDQRGGLSLRQRHQHGGHLPADACRQAGHGQRGSGCSVLLRHGGIHEGGHQGHHGKML